MGPNQDNQNAEPVSGSDIVFRNEPKSNKGMIAGMVCLALLAIGGISFGVWAMMDGNAKVEQLNSRIDSLKQQDSELQEDNNNVAVAAVDNDNDYENPIIRSSSSDEEFRIWLESSIVDEKRMEIGVKDGKVDICSIYNRSGAFISDCTINGITGEIFDMIEFGEGQDNGGSNIGFIMTDGTVQYFPFVEAMNNNSFVIKGKLGLDGFITNAINITAGPTDPGVVGGYGSTIFVLRDGSYVKYDESMTH